MPVIRPADIAEVVVKGQQLGQAVVNVFHYQVYRTDNPLQNVDSTLFLQSFRTMWRAKVIPAAPSSYSIVEYYCGVITGRVGNPNWTPASPPSVTPYLLEYGGQDLLAGELADTGTKLGAALPTFGAAGVAWLAESRKRMFRGSNRFLVGVEDDTGGDLWTNAFLTGALQQMAGGFLPNLETDGGNVTKTMSLCIFGRRSYLKASNNPVPVLANFASEVINYRVNPYVTSQVSRKQRLRFG